MDYLVYRVWCRYQIGWVFKTNLHLVVCSFQSRPHNRNQKCSYGAKWHWISRQINIIGTLWIFQNNGCLMQVSNWKCLFWILLWLSEAFGWLLLKLQQLIGVFDWLFLSKRSLIWPRLEHISGVTNTLSTLGWQWAANKKLCISTPTAFEALTSKQNGWPPPIFSALWLSKSKYLQERRGRFFVRK